MDKETLQRASHLQQRIDRIIAFQRDLRENPQIIIESRSHAGGTSNDEWRNGLLFSKDDELPEFYDLITKFINRQREVLEEQLQKL
jgi:hypothetical protein